MCRAFFFKGDVIHIIIVSCQGKWPQRTSNTRSYAVVLIYIYIYTHVCIYIYIHIYDTFEPES